MDNIETLRQQAKNELNNFDDKRYLNRLKAITEISQDVTDHLIYVFQLIKEKEFETAFRYYSSNLRPIYPSQIKQGLHNRGQLAMCCEDFFKWTQIKELKERLALEASKIEMDELQTARVKKFIEQIYNLNQFYEMSHREDHRPSYIAYPNLKDTPFVKLRLNNDPIPLIEKIKTEVFSILEHQKGIPYVKKIQGVPKGLEHLAGNEDWRSVILYEAGELKVAEAEVLINILKDNFDMADCAPMSPEVMISILEPGTHITPHYGTSNIKHTLHIPILLPEGDLGIVVGGEKKKWQESECLLFDDSFLHEAWNKSEQTRIVLILDLWHHDISQEERLFLQKVMPDIVTVTQSLIL